MSFCGHAPVTINVLTFAMCQMLLLKITIVDWFLMRFSYFLLNLRVAKERFLLVCIYIWMNLRLLFFLYTCVILYYLRLLLPSFTFGPFWFYLFNIIDAFINYNLVYWFINAELFPTNLIVWLMLGFCRFHWAFLFVNNAIVRKKCWFWWWFFILKAAVFTFTGLYEIIALGDY